MLTRRYTLLLSCLLLVNPPLTAQTCNEHMPRNAPDSRYIDHDNGTITDTVTGLMWKQCGEGISTTSTPCDTGSANTFTWQDALQRAADVNTGNAGKSLGYDDWRLPNIKELKSLIEKACYSPANNTTHFPNTSLPGYWSSSTSAMDASSAWGIDFNEGSDIGYFKGNSYRVRLVRAGQ